MRQYSAYHQKNEGIEENQAKDGFRYVYFLRQLLLLVNILGFLFVTFKDQSMLKTTIAR